MSVLLTAALVTVHPVPASADASERVTGAGRAQAAAASLARTAVPAGRGRAAPKPAGVDISGGPLAEPLRLRSATHPVEVGAVIDQVSWLGGISTSSGPGKNDLGPKYTVVVLAGDVATQTYDLYPLAKGGPRVYRPGKQPDASRRVKAGWFLGRLNMSETLRKAGVPLDRQADAVGGGVGGGERVLPDDSLDPAKNIDKSLDELQRLLLLNVGVMLVITLGLAGIALLIRRRTR